MLADHVGHEPALCPGPGECLTSTELQEQEMIPLLGFMRLQLGYYTWIWAPQSKGDAANWRETSGEQPDLGGGGAGAGDM